MGTAGARAADAVEIDPAASVTACLCRHLDIGDGKALVGAVVILTRDLADQVARINGSPSWAVELDPRPDSLGSG